MTGSSPDTSACGDPGDIGCGEELRRQLARAVKYWRLSVKDVWLHYFSLGGSVGEYELDAYINSSYRLSSLQHDILAQAINEIIDTQPTPPRAPYSSSSCSTDEVGTASYGDEVTAETRKDGESAADTIDGDTEADEY